MDTPNPVCICDFNIETLNQYFLHCPRFSNERQNLLPKIERIILDIFRKSDVSITLRLLYGDPSFSTEVNTNIINSSTDYISSAKKVWIYSFYRHLILILNLRNKFSFPSLLELSSLCFFIIISYFLGFLVSSRYPKCLFYLDIVIF